MAEMGTCANCGRAVERVHVPYPTWHHLSRAAVDYPRVRPRAEHTSPASI